MSYQFHKYPSVYEAQQFDRMWLVEEFFPLADRMERVFKTGCSNCLKGKRIVILFYQPSTRTMASFKFAISILGGEVIFETNNARDYSSGAKGESIIHTIKTFCRYQPDLIIIRYDRSIGAEIAAKVSDVPIINAGDRNPGQHPTQALLDIRTIHKCFGEVEGKRIVISGDNTGRTNNSLAYILGKFPGVSIDFVSPPSLKISDGVKDYLHRHDIQFREFSDLRKVAETADCIYQTRTQKECGSLSGDKNGDDVYCVVDKTITSMMKEKSIIMHPLPIDENEKEITDEVEDDPRAVYLTKQLDSGLFTRMALLKMILAPKA